MKYDTVCGTLKFLLGLTQSWRYVAVHTASGDDVVLVGVNGLALTVAWPTVEGDPLGTLLGSKVEAEGFFHRRIMVEGWGGVSALYLVKEQLTVSIGT